jgi:ankyrin repeat protein
MSSDPGSSLTGSGSEASSGMESLRSAIDSGQTDKVLELLKMGLPIVVDGDGQTALHLAASAGHLEMVEALIQAGCDVGIQDFVSNDMGRDCV